MVIGLVGQMYPNRDFRLKHMSQISASHCEINTWGCPHLMSDEYRIDFERSYRIKDTCEAAYVFKPLQGSMLLGVKNLGRIVERTTMRYNEFKIAYKLWRVTMKDLFGSRYITNT